MTLMPRLAVTCGRCGKRREGIRHVCVSNSARKATVKPKITLGKCPVCGKLYGGNPLAHVCRPKSDFKARKSRAAKQEKAAGRKRRQQERHDYQACSDKDCPRPLCTAYKTGQRTGYQEGNEDGYGAGYATGFVDGIQACPLTHK